MSDSATPGNAGGPINVRTWEPGDTEGWDTFVLRHPRATLFHLTGWKRVLETALRHRSRYLVALRDEGVCGVLPLCLCRSIRGRLGLCSLPHSVYGGPVGDDAAVEYALLDAARTLAYRCGARSLELRNRHRNMLDLPAMPGFLTFEKELPATAVEVHRAFPKKAREAINQATKRHKLEADHEGTLDEFYPLLAAAYRRLGTPVFPKAFFGAMRRELPGQTDLLLVRHEGRPVAGVLSALFRGTMMPLYSGESDDVAHLKANNFKYYRLMEHAVTMGCRRFDFGRSRASNEGVVRFKQNQGFEAEELPYQTLGFGKDLAGTADPNRGVFPKIRRVWRRLPMAVTRALGPRLVRYFP